MKPRRTIKATPCIRPDSSANQKRRRSQRRRGLLFEGLESRQLLASDWQNSLNRLDVTDDGWVVPLDALSIINELNRPSIIDSQNRLPPRPPGMPPGNWLDTSGDGLLTATDAILVINALNRDTGIPTVTAALQNDTGPNGSFNTDGITSDARITGTTRDELLGVKSLEAQLDGGNFVSVAYDRRTGAFSFQPGLAGNGSADGTHTVSFRAQDLRGNESTLFSVTFLLDTIAPATPTGTRLSAGSDTGSSSSDGVTSDNTPTFVGDALPGTLITLRSGATLLGQASGDTPWSITTGQLSDGPQTLGIQAHDLAGNSSALRELTVTIDTQAPAAPTGLRLDAASDSGASASDAITRVVRPTVTGAAEDGLLIRLLIDGQEHAQQSSSSGFALSTLTLTDGTHTARAVAEDLAGNSSGPSDALQILIDTIAPPAPTGLRLDAGSDSGASDSDGITNDTTPTFIGSSETSSLVELLLGGQLAGQTSSAGSWSVTTGKLADGTRTATARAIDLAGNVSPLSAAFDVVIDTVAPAQPTGVRLDASSDTGASDSDGITSDTTPTVRGLAELSSRVELFVDGTAAGAVDSNGSWTMTTTALVDGDHQLTARAIDLAGNVGSKSAATTITIDTIAPDAPSGLHVDASSDSGISNTDGVTNDVTPLIAGAAESGTMVTLTVDGQAAGSVGSDRNWSLEPGTLKEGAHVITATAQDLAGNVSGVSSELKIVIDTVAPARPVNLRLDKASDSGASQTDGVTNVAAPMVIGESESGTRVTVLVDGSSIGQTDSNGLWSMISPALVDGTHDITATASDLAGNVSSLSTAFTVKIDTIAPGAPTGVRLAASSDSGISDSDGITSDATPTITGVAESSSRVELFVDSLLAGSADSSGSWSITTSSLLDGTHTVSARATDLAGNVGGKSTAISITVDTIAPAAPSGLRVAASSDSGASDSDGVTNDTTPQLTGIAESGTVVTLKLNGQDAGSTDSTGIWSLEPNTLKDGTYSVTAVSTDRAGNVSLSSDELKFVIDTVAPASPSGLRLDAGGDSGASNTDGITNVSAPTILGESDPGTRVTVFVDGNAIGQRDAAAPWSIVAPTLADGAHAITATASDLAGNASVVSSTLSVRIDTTAPEAPTGLRLDASSDSGVSDTDGITNDATPTVVGLAESLARVELFVDNLLAGSADSSGSWSITTPTLGDGDYALSARAIDLAGNVGAKSAATTITIDTLAPTAPAGLRVAASSDSGTSDSDGITNDTTPRLSGNSESGTTVTLLIDGKSAGNTDSDGTWSVEPSALSDGSYSVTAVASDRAGNASGASSVLTLVIDTVAPASPFNLRLDQGSDSGASDTDGITNDTTPTIRGDSEAGSSVTVLIDGTAIGQFVSSGPWAIDAPNLTDGTHTVTASAADIAGNASGPSVKLSIQIDTAAPEPPAQIALAASSDSGISDTDGITNDATPTVTGLAESQSRVELFVDGLSAGSTDSSGSWSITTALLGEGGHDLTARAVDLAGNVGLKSAATRITIDTVAPAAPDGMRLAAASDSGESDSDGITNDTTPEFTGNAEAGSVVTILVDALSIGSVSSNGKWSIESGPLTDGTHVAVATARDAAGNESLLSSELRVVIDTLAPESPANLRLSAASDSGTSNSDGITNIVTPTIQGESETDVRVTVKVDGATIGQFISNGAWSIDAPTLTEGKHSVTATAADLAGNASATSAALNIVVDTVAPGAPTGLRIDAASDSGVSDSDGITNDTTPTLVGLAESESIVTVFLGNVASGQATSNGAWSQTLDALNDGEYSITATATDVAGNTSAHSGVLAATIDTVAPAAPANIGLTKETDTGISDQDGITRNPTPTIVGQAESLSTVTVLIDGKSVGSATSDGSWNFQAPLLADGYHAVTATATDRAGNVGAESSKFELLIDTSAPAVASQIRLDLASDTGASSSDGVTRFKSPTATGDAESGSTVELYVDGVLAGIGTANSPWSIATGDLTDGTHKLAARVIDPAGNLGELSSEVTIVVDTVAPTAPLFDLSATSDTGVRGDQITSAARVTLLGTSEAAAQIKLAGSSLSSLVAQNGKFQLTGVPLAVGDNSVALKSIDLAGNESSTTMTIVRLNVAQVDDPVLVWNKILLEAIRMDATPPPLASRGMAMVQAAVFDVINSIEQKPSLYVALPAAADASAEAGVVAAAHGVLSYLFPAQTAEFDARRTDSLAAIADGAAKSDGIALGEAIASAIIAVRSGDGWDTFVSYLPGSEAGDWLPTAPMFAPALLPHWGDV
jgi:hypothetical protein